MDELRHRKDVPGGRPLAGRAGFRRAVAVLALVFFAALVSACSFRVDPPPKISGSVFIEADGKRGASGGEMIFREGDLLRANTSGIAGSGEPFFQWRRGATVIGGETGKTYASRPEDVGYSIVVVAFTDGNEGGIISEPTFPILGPGDEFSGGE